MAAVIVKDLVKDYGALRAVDGLSFAVEEGEVFAVVGPNGAGKTSTVEILEGHRRRTAGEVSVLGFDPQTGGRRFRERIGIVLQEAGMDEDFSVVELLRLYAGLYPRPRSIDEVIALVGLEDKRDARTKSLSGGQRRRLDLGLGLVGDPELLFLDEPTTGFDPSARRQAWDVVAGLCAVGKTIVLTTHYMEEARYLADRVAVIAGGRLVALGTPEELVAGAGGPAVVTFRLPAGLAAADLPAVPGAVRVAGDTVEVRSEAPTRDLHRLSGWAVERGLELEGLTTVARSFEDAYLDLIAHAGGPDDG